VITQKSIEAVMEAARIEEVVRDYVGLRRRGTNLIGICPFHSEKTPSFSVSPAKNIFKCFGCGKGGDAVHFLMEHDHLSFADAIRQLAERFQVPLEETKPSPEWAAQQQAEESLFVVNQFARDFFVRQLWDTDMGKSVGLSYFRSRGFTEATIRKFQLGFAPDKYDLLYQDAQKAGFSADQLQQLGLVSAQGRDFFRGRAMFAIHNGSGKVIGFGGRILNATAQAPKYINTPETEIYHKSEVLYGLFFAKKAIRAMDTCILVEGYTDVVSMHQAGIEHVVAASGTALTSDQIRLIKRHTRNVLMLFDGDQAGIKAAMRGLLLLLEEGMAVKIVLLPPSEDPDSYVKQLGAEGFKSFLETAAEDFILHTLNAVDQEAGKDPVKKATLVKEVLHTISLIPDALQRSIYIREAAAKLGLEEQLIHLEVNKAILQARNKRPADRLSQTPPILDTPEDVAATRLAAQQEKVAVVTDEHQEREIVRILISFGDRIFDPASNLVLGDYLLEELADILDTFEHPVYREFVEFYRDLRQTTTVPTERYFITHTDRKISQLAIDLVSSPFELSENWEKMWEIFLQTQKPPDENFIKDASQALLRFKLRKVMASCAENQRRIERYNEEGDFEKVVFHLKVQKKLISLRNEIAGELGTVVL
jgi:DNA primase